MIAKIIFLAVCLTASVQGDEREVESFLNTLSAATDEAGRKILETLAVILKVPEEVDEMSRARFESILWECTVQKTTVNKTVTEALFKGMSKNKLFSDFQCIYGNSDETFRKIDEIKSKIPGDSENVKKKGVGRISPIGLILPGLYDFVQDLQAKRSEDLSKAKPEEIPKIMADVSGKLKLLYGILDKVQDLVTDLKMKVLEDYVMYAFQIENLLKKIQKEGSQKIKKCVN